MGGQGLPAMRHAHLQRWASAPKKHQEHAGRTQRATFHPRCRQPIRRCTPCHRLAVQPTRDGGKGQTCLSTNIVHQRGLPVSSRVTVREGISIGVHVPCKPRPTKSDEDSALKSNLTEHLFRFYRSENIAGQRRDISIISNGLNFMFSGIHCAGQIADERESVVHHVGAQPVVPDAREID